MLFTTQNLIKIRYVIFGAKYMNYETCKLMSSHYVLTPYAS
jgi:hypothetical protein